MSYVIGWEQASIISQDAVVAVAALSSNHMSSSRTESTFSAESYFATQSAPPNLEQDILNVRTFIQRHAQAGRKVVLVTVRTSPYPRSASTMTVHTERGNDGASGAQRVSLNARMPCSPAHPRYLQCPLSRQLQCWYVVALAICLQGSQKAVGEGTRGATSAEYFLKAGYAVIFMHRQFSLQPFSRHYSHSTHPFLDFLEIESDAPEETSSASPAHISVKPSERTQLLQVLTAYKAVQKTGTLHTLTFVTVNDYLWLLRAVSQELSVLGRNALYYLAAAVSDFFLPRQKLVS